MRVADDGLRHDDPAPPGAVGARVRLLWLLRAARAARPEVSDEQFAGRLTRQGFAAAGRAGAYDRERDAGMVSVGLAGAYERALSLPPGRLTAPALLLTGQDRDLPWPTAPLPRAPVTRAQGLRVLAGVEEGIAAGTLTGAGWLGLAGLVTHPDGPVLPPSVLNHWAQVLLTQMLASTGDAHRARYAALVTLAGDPATRPAVLHAVTSHACTLGAPRLGLAVRVLAHTGDPTVTARLTDWSQTGPARLRAAATRALPHPDAPTHPTAWVDAGPVGGYLRAATGNPDPRTDPMLTRLLQEALTGDPPALLAASPYRAALAGAAVADLTGGDPVATEAAAILLPWVAGPGQHRSLVALAGHRDPVIAAAALAALPHTGPGPADLDLIGLAARPGLAAAAVDVAGLSGHPQLAALSTLPGLPVDVRAAATWWQRTGPALTDPATPEDLTFPGPAPPDDLAGPVAATWDWDTGPARPVAPPPEPPLAPTVAACRPGRPHTRVRATHPGGCRRHHARWAL